MSYGIYSYFILRDLGNQNISNLLDKKVCQQSQWQSHSTIRNLVRILRAKKIYFISTKHQQALALYNLNPCGKKAISMRVALKFGKREAVRFLRYFTHFSQPKASKRSLWLFSHKRKSLKFTHFLALGKS